MKPAVVSSVSDRPARVGAYIHFPYCLSKCPYCDFASVVAARVPHRRYAAAIVAELERRRADHGRPDGGLDSLYFGGGTPSLWEPDCVAEVIEAVERLYGLAPDAEITLEANPGASDRRRFSRLRVAGVNRLSIGIQSFDAATLAALGRRHSGAEAIAAVERAAAAGIDNVSIDLIFGAPGQTLEGSQADVARAASLGVAHVSAYGLTLEGLAEDVRLAKEVRRGRVTVPDDAAQERMGATARAVLADAGYRRYEISNFARPGRASRHNLLYWHGHPWVAAGCGAHGFFRTGGGGVRYGNPRKPEAYLAAVERGGTPELERERLDAAALFAERLFLGLRLCDGLDLAQAAADTLGAVPAATERALEGLAVRGLIVRDGRRVRCTERGLDFHSEVAVELLPDAPSEEAAREPAPGSRPAALPVLG